MWIVCYTLSIVILFITIIIAFVISRISKNRKVFIKPGKCFFTGVFVALFLLFLPIYRDVFTFQSLYTVIQSVFLSIHTVLRVFVLDIDYEIIKESIGELEPWLQLHYSITTVVLFVVAPLCTFGFILSFFKNITARRRYLFGYFKDAYIFSELNEKSIKLAESIHARNKKTLIVYTSIDEKSEEQSSEQMDQVKRIGAICFKKDILSPNFKRHKGKISFFIIGDNEEKNINQTLKLIDTYRTVKNSNLYLFSTRLESELLLTQTDKGRIKARRIDEVRSLIYRTLYEKGIDLFRNAKTVSENEKLISAVVVGMGRHGTEMVKALSWYCQMDGYKIIIDAFDKDENAESVFSASCPEIMSDEHNGVYIDGEAQYKINIHSGYDVNTKEFSTAIRNLKSSTYVFVALGKDEDNIKTSVYLRMLFERMGVKPVIQAVVFSAVEKEALSEIKNHKKQSYNIDFIGDIKTSYSEKVIINSDLESSALSRHKGYGSEEDFWAYEYNYRSSMTSAVFIKARKECGIPGADKPIDKRTEEELLITRKLSHRKWNADMRSQGYIYSGSTNRESRNDLAKMHNDLVSFDNLPEEDKKNDDE